MSDSSDVTEIPIAINLSDAIGENKRLGDNHRLVRMIPLPGKIFRPAIWISPYTFFSQDFNEIVRIAIVLLSPGPPPEFVQVTVPAAALQKFPLGPVEW